VLLDTLRSEELIGPLTILDGHITIETTEGIFVVPSWFLHGTEIAGIICITNDPLIIERRRKEKGLVSGVAIEGLQEAEKRSARERAEQLGVVYRQVSADDQGSFEAAVGTILGR
jgi:adenylate kinase